MKHFIAFFTLGILGGGGSELLGIHPWFGL